MPTECIANFDTCFNGKIKPEEGDVLSPWVRITLDNPTATRNAGGTITVGNRSFEPTNTACIKNFEYGKSDSFSCRIIIQDEQGGSFVDFAEALLKDYKCNVAPMFMSIEYGWVKTFCGESESAGPTNSNKIYAMLQSIETHFSGGKFQYELTGTDMFTVGQEGNDDELIGGDGDEEQHYTDAVRKLATEGVPPTCGSVNWYRIDEQGILRISEGERFYGIGEKERIKGPKGKWQANGHNKLEAIYRWTSEVTNPDQTKGFVIVFNESKPDGELQIWEDPKPSCGQNVNITCLKAYVVNGGKESPVIEFNPSFKWNFWSLTSGGGNIDTTDIDPTNNQSKTLGRRECLTLNRASNPGAGGNTTLATTNENTENKGETLGDRGNANDKNFRALDLAHSIEADLVVVGDPELQPIDFINRFIGIIFINPYHLNPPKQSGDANCPEWIIDPPCNPVLSNDAWLIKSVTHKIEDGKYRTVLKVTLAVPGIDIDTGERLGGGQLGWKPPPGCPSAVE